MKKKYIVSRNKPGIEKKREYLSMLNVPPGFRGTPWTDNLFSAFKFPSAALAEKTVEKFSEEGVIYQISEILVKS